MGKVLDLADKLWTGEVSTADSNPLLTFLGLEELGSDLAFVSAFGNVSVIDTGEGLLLVDTGSKITSQMVLTSVRDWRSAQVGNAIYTHGHVDHVFGIQAFDTEAKENGWPRPHVIAHQAVAERFDRYTLTAGYNASINSRQFRVPKAMWPTDYRYPDMTFRDHHVVDQGAVTLELHHDRGETDDHAWAFWPERRVLFTGDLFIWASPNCGNPQKAQRYPREWALALGKMAALEPEVLLPGHGPPIIGKKRVDTALRETAALLTSLCDQVLALMNEGARLDDVIHGVEVPTDLLERPYLRPVYDDPQFIVRTLWRRYGGWYDGNPARLLPPADRALAGEVCELSGGAIKLAERAAKLVDDGELSLACQLAEWAWQAAPDDAAVAAIRKQIYSAREKAQSSLMARSIFAAAARESDSK